LLCAKGETPQISSFLGFLLSFNPSGQTKFTFN
jgi:hypothetical protein